MPYLQAMAEFRAGVRRIAREKHGEAASLSARAGLTWSHCGHSGQPFSLVGTSRAVTCLALLTGPGSTTPPSCDTHQCVQAPRVPDWWPPGTAQS